MRKNTSINTKTAKMNRKITEKEQEIQQNNL